MSINSNSVPSFEQHVSDYLRMGTLPPSFCSSSKEINEENPVQRAYSFCWERERAQNETDKCILKIYEGYACHKIASLFKDDPKEHWYASLRAVCLLDEALELWADTPSITLNKELAPDIVFFLANQYIQLAERLKTPSSENKFKVLEAVVQTVFLDWGLKTEEICARFYAKAGEYLFSIYENPPPDLKKPTLDSLDFVRMFIRKIKVKEIKTDTTIRLTVLSLKIDLIRKKHRTLKPNFHFACRSI